MSYNVFIPPNLPLYHDPNYWQGAYASVIAYKISNADSLLNGTITTGNVNSLCVKGTMDVPFTFNNYYAQYVDSGFKVELSDSSGSFANPFIIGSGKYSPIHCTVPFFNANGNNYRVRVVSNTNPKIIGTPSQPLAIINGLHVSIFPDNYNLNNYGSCNPTQLHVEPPGAYYCKWTYTPYGTNYSINIYNYTSIINAVQGYGEDYMATVTDSATGCTASASFNDFYMSNGQNQNLNFILPDTICLDDAPVLLSQRTIHGAFSGNGISGNTFYPDSAGYGLHGITYATFDTVSCYSPDTTEQYIHNTQ